MSGIEASAGEGTGPKGPGSEPVLHLPTVLSGASPHPPPCLNLLTWEIG